MTGALAGKSVIVTGAGRGIGREVALLAGAEGASVVACDLGVAVDGDGADRGPAEEVAAEIRGKGGKAISNTESVTDPAAAERMVQSAVDAFGRIDGVVNVAGILRDRIFHRMSHVDWQMVIECT